MKKTKITTKTETFRVEQTIQSVRELLSKSDSPLTANQLKTKLKARHGDVLAAIWQLLDAGLIRRNGDKFEPNKGLGPSVNMSNDERGQIWEKQRKKRGFDDTETWSLDTTIAQFIAPRLKVFKEQHFCHPPSITMKEWDEILQQMIDGFEAWGAADGGPSKCDEAAPKIEIALSLFQKWFYDLWW